MQQRIFGIETEYAANGHLPGGRRMLIEEVVNAMFGSWRRQEFLRNGARLYVDHGSHPEYATGECSSLRDLVTHDKAGERILEAMAIAAEEQLRRTTPSATVYVLKNNTDVSGNTYGCHENYLVSRGHDMADLSRLLTPFFGTRQMLVGAGKILLVRGEPVYCFSQRAPHIHHDVGSKTTMDRSMISTRDQPHADERSYRRLHVVVGDSNMSETTTLLKVGSTHLVLRMIEAGVDLSDLELLVPPAALHDTNLDLTGRAAIQLTDGRRVTALYLQEEYLRRACEFARAAGIASDPETAQVLELWGRTLRAIRTGDRKPIERDIDWAIKLRMLEDYAAKHQLDFASPRIRMLDFAYHDVRRDRGLYYLLERRGQVSRVTSDLDIFRAKTYGSDTRAALRGAFIAWAKQYGIRIAVNWEKLVVESERLPPVNSDAKPGVAPTPITYPQSTIKIADPFASTNSDVEKLKAEVTARRGASAMAGQPRSPHPQGAPNALRRWGSAV